MTRFGFLKNFTSVPIDDNNLLRQIVGVPTMTAEDKKWEIEADARTLVEAEMVRKDPKRFKAAVAQIKKENAARKTAVKP